MSWQRVCTHGGLDYRDLFIVKTFTCPLCGEVLKARRGRTP